MLKLVLKYFRFRFLWPLAICTKTFVIFGLWTNLSSSHKLQNLRMYKSILKFANRFGYKNIPTVKIAMSVVKLFYLVSICMLLINCNCSYATDERRLTMSIPKSGACPVMPNTVVLRYRSWPARSMNVITFEDFSQILTQSRDPCSGLLTTLPVTKT